MTTRRDLVRDASRRRFLRGAGGVAIALPFLSSFPRYARGDGLPIPKRFVTMFTPNGTMMDAWKSTTHTGITFPKDGILHGLAGGYLNTDGTVATDLRPQLTMVNGLNLGDPTVSATVPHFQIRQFLTGAAISYDSSNGVAMIKSPSLEYHLAKTLPGGASNPTLQFGVLCDPTSYYAGALSFDETGVANPPENSPLKMFSRLFGGLPSDAGVAARMQAQKKSVLDDSLAEFQTLTGALGTDDGYKLQAHAQAVRDLEVAIESTVRYGAACVKPGVPVDYPQDLAHLESIVKVQLDLLVMALACDLTRYATLQFSDPVSLIVYDFLKYGAQTVSGDHHTLSHMDESDSMAHGSLVSINTWFAQKFEYLIRHMLEVPEGQGGSMFDNSVILWGNEFSHGNMHDSSNIPIVLAGSAGGYFKTGQNLTVSGQHNQLLVSIANALGSPIRQFGDPIFGSGPLPGLAA